MTDPVVERLAVAVSSARSLYHRLVLVVGPVGSGKTAALRQLADSLGLPLVNLNLELSQELLDVPKGERRLAAPRLLKELVERVPGETVLLDNTEILFAPDLQLDPLRALQQLSRDRTVVASWGGLVSSDRLTYAEPSHPEFRDYPAQGLVVVTFHAAHPGAGAQERP